jgi:hypothetical protein
MAATRGMCPACSGNYAVAQDGTPYKHNTPGTEGVCPGCDQQALPLPRWAVYGPPLVILRIDGDATPLESIDVTDSHQATLLGTFDHEPTVEDLTSVAPEGVTVPTGPDPDSDSTPVADPDMVVTEPETEPIPDPNQPQPDPQPAPDPNPAP